jgi:hypothetical protein
MNTKNSKLILKQETLSNLNSSSKNPTQGYGTLVSCGNACPFTCSLNKRGE